jgi:hypothetical protein
MNGAMFFLLLGDVGSALLWIANNYFPLGSFWILIGLGIFATMQAKFENMQYSVFAMALYGIGVLPWISINGMAILPVISMFEYYIIAFVVLAGVYAILVRE